MKNSAFGNTPTGISVHNKIEQAHHEWMTALDVVDDPIFLHDKEFRILRCNKAYQQRAGVPFKEIIGQPYYKVFPKTTAIPNCCSRVIEKTEPATDKGEILVGDIIYRLRAVSVNDKQGDYLYSVHILEDITDRKMLGIELWKNEQYFSGAFNYAAIGMALVGLDGSWLKVNQALCQMLGYAVPELLACTFQDITHADDLDADRAYVARMLSGEIDHYQMEKRYLHKLGHLVWVTLSVSLVRDKLGRPLYFVSQIEDITERKQAESEIQRANRALATLGAVNHALVHATDENTLLQAVCDAIIEQKGYWMAWVGYVQHDAAKSIKIMARAGHEKGYLVIRELTWAESKNGMRPCGRAIRSGETQLCQNIANDPQYLPWRDEAAQRGYAASIALPLTGKDGEVFGTLAVYSDEVNAFSPSEVSLLEEMAGDLAFGVRSLHIRHERDLTLVKNQEQLVQLVFQNEEKEKRAAELAIANKELAFQNEEKEKRAAELAIANKELAFQNEEKEKRAAELTIANKELAFQNEEKEKRAAELTIANKELAFQNEEKEKRAAELTIANKGLQDSLEDTVRAIATIGEMRDPYTAGHQVRVADLATAIAKQLGLPDEQVHAIHLAGMVHDLGKIKIPAEILSKPGRITDIEFSLIKVHPQAGYDILKGIDFPWPIAQMVLQHHERLDGSGYPQGLKGEAILLEARILSVADVVEAMSSHRPYRPGLGIEVALEEIAKQRGIYFDPAVVDACLALFREQHYSFKS